MADSLFASAEAKALLDSGVVAKLSAAAEDKAPLFKITSTGPLAGVQWRRLAQAANLNDDEMDSLRDWVEETIGDGAATRFAAPLPDVAVTVKKEKAALELRPSAAGGRVQSKEIERAPAEAAFEQYFGGAPAAGEAAYGQAHNVATAPSAMSEQEREDVLAHGFSDSSKISDLTWVVHTARPPPLHCAEFKYGVDPSSVRKLYSGLQSSVGTLLWELVKSNTSTMKDFQNHFYRAVQAALDPDVRARISNHWTEMTQYFDSVELVRAYYKKYLTIRSGRGLPKLIDEHIVMLVMCSELEQAREGASGSSSGEQMQAMVALVEKQTRVIESVKESMAELKLKVGELKSQVNDLKTGHQSLKVKVEAGKAKGRVCTYCGQEGHTEPFCHKKTQDKAAEKASADA